MTAGADLSLESRERSLSDLVATARRLLLRRDRPGKPLSGDEYDAWEEDVEEWLLRSRPSVLRAVGTKGPNAYRWERPAGQGATA